MGDAGLEPNARIVRLDRIARDLHGEIDIGIAPGEALSRYTHDNVVFTDHLDGLAEHTGVAAKVTLPEAIAEHDDVVLVRQVLLGTEGAAEQRRHTQHVEESRCDLGGGHLLRPLDAADGSRAP